ncbi:MAG: hypothetical protein MUE58_11485, partial [Chitinophagaceae bacterium]|nr:hypothetical protein [Chitinophagaceae bacterium]
MKSGSSLHTLARRSLRVIGWLLAFFLVVIIFLLLLLETSWGNNLIRKGAQSWLRNKLQTELAIGQLRLDGLHGISLREVILRDRNRDTLLSVDTVSVSFDLSGIASRKIVIPGIRIAGLHSEILRQRGDRTFNFQFIIDAFASN